MAHEVLVWSPTVDRPRAAPLSWRRFLGIGLRATPVALALVVAGGLHGYNMFGSPFYFDDEGIYISQAWSAITSGRLAPYTYFYDHPPLGWFTVGFLVELFGGFDTFGASVNAGRVVMLILHVLSTLLVYRVTCRLGGTATAGLIAALLFALSPFQIIFGRQLLLDNLAVFWLLVSVYFATAERLSIWGAVLSGAAMGIAILNKEIVGPLLPGMLLLLWVRLHPEIRLMSLATWLFVTVSVASFYPLYALLKGELFPYGSVFDFSSSPHVSLIDGIMFHQNRASDLGVFDPNSLFWNAARLWWHTDPGLVVALLGAIGMSVLLRRRHPGVLGLGVMLIGLLAFLARGGVVFEFWLLIGVPVVAIIIGLAIDDARLALAATFAQLWRIASTPPAVLRELGRDFRRMLADEITEAEFLRYVRLAISSRARRARRALGWLVPGPVRRLAGEYRRMVRGEINERQFAQNVGAGLRSGVLRVLSLPWTAQDAIISWLEAAARRVAARDRRSGGSDALASEAKAAVSTFDILRVAGALTVTAALIATAILGYRTYARSYERALVENETGPQVQAINWLEDHAAHDDFLVIDTYAFVDLQDFQDAHPFWKVDLDPEVRDDILRGDWRGIDYVALTPVMSSAVGDGRLPLVAKALENADMVERFRSAGEWVEIWRVDREQAQAGLSQDGGAETN